MKSLKHCIQLSSIVKIYVPSTKNIKENFDCSEWKEKTLRFLSEIFQGSTETNAYGAWLTQQGELVKEKITMVFSYARQEKLNENIEKIYDFCVHMKNNLSQERIALEINGIMYFI